MPDARRSSERSFSKRPLSAQPQFAEPEPARDGHEWSSAEREDPFTVDRRDGSDPAVEHAAKPQSAYWDASSSATMPTDFRRPGNDRSPQITPAPQLGAVAVEQPLA